MDGFLSALRRAGAVLAVYALFFLVRYCAEEWSAVRLDTVKPVYLHYEFIELRLRTPTWACARSGPLSPLPRA